MYLRLIAALLLLASTAAAQAPPQLIPMPREISPLPAQSLPNGVSVQCSACNTDDLFTAADLRDTLAARGLPTASANGLSIVLQRLADHPDPSFTSAMRPEGYTIAATPSTLTLTAATATGLFYAAQTVKQMIERNPNGSFTLHPANIRDWPAMQYRGLSDDLSRGPLDTLAFQEKIVRTLAAYKDNLYSPYFENIQQYASNPLSAPPGGSISAADARALVAYAADFHVLIVPDQEAFGHLHHVLTWEQYQPLAETPHGAVLAPGQPGSLALITQQFTELAQLYPSPFLHIGADETTDLGLGQTKAEVDARGLGPVYLDFLQNISDALRPLHRKLLFWGDIAEKSPELLQALPEDFKQNTIAISWHYNAPGPNGFLKYINDFKSAGFEFWVAPGINNWSRVYPNFNHALDNIQVFTAEGQDAGATGQLNTNWYDDGEALASNNWYGILFGCAAAWQPGTSSIPQFEQSYAQVFHGDATGDLNQAQLELMAAQDILQNSAHVGDGSDGLFWLDPWSKDGQTYAAKIRPYTHELRLHAERALTLIAEARAAYPPLLSTTQPGTPSFAHFAKGGINDASSTTRSSVVPPSGPWALNPGSSAYNPADAFPSNPSSLRETNAIDALELGARRLDFIGLKFQLADEISTLYAEAQTNALSRDKKTRALVSGNLSDIIGTDGRLEDIISAYSLLRGLYAQTWLRTNRPYALRPVLERFDYTTDLWLARRDKARSAQRQWSDTHTLPTAFDAGIPPTSPLPQ